MSPHRFLNTSRMIKSRFSMTVTHHPGCGVVARMERFQVLETPDHIPFDRLESIEDLPFLNLAQARIGQREKQVVFLGKVAPQKGDELPAVLSDLGRDLVIVWVSQIALHASLQSFVRLAQFAVVCEHLPEQALFSRVLTFDL